ncbi:hypothetical protein AQUCO_04400056v1 [Aquilegia coerulea]|uniref:PIG-P domain-containing protein n=1 Tax=Aquilegia coerulea TaxID=218851 RepID=A0A2G5CMS4_AQUCA|nr:hypothetical protein AQUCO_04400056v1 [Aquilegia coerulea]
MGDFSMNSPRRILSLSKNRATSFLVPDEKVSGFAVSEEHGPKPSEVYGFVGSISIVVATVIFFMWAYIPESWLHLTGITYYPSKYWAVAVPTYSMVAVVLAIGFYIGQNFVATPPPTSLNTMFDEYSREHSSIMAFSEDEQPIEPISDIGIDQVNELMFNSKLA